jgi:multiple sugar transport system permease protein
VEVEAVSKVELEVQMPIQSRPRQRRARSFRHHAVIYLFLLPAIAFFIGFSVYPILYSLVMSFTDWPLTGHISWVGFQNYINVLNDPVVRSSTLNDFFFLIWAVPLQFILGLLVAIGLDRPMLGRGIMRLFYYLPVITSYVVVTFLFEYLFDTDYGLINWFLESLHIINTPIDWLGNPHNALIVSAFLAAWKGVGYTMMIFLAALQNVSEELYEAAAIDGAGQWRRFWSITLPSIRGSMFFVAVILMMGSLQMFMQIFILTQGGPANESQVPLVYMYQQAFSFLNFGFASAMSWLISIVIVILTIIQFWIFKPKNLNLREGHV